MPNYNFVREFLGIERQMLAVYDVVKGYPPPSDMSEPGVPDTVELARIYLDRDGDGDFIELDSSEAFDEELCDEIMDSLE